MLCHAASRPARSPLFASSLSCLLPCSEWPVLPPPPPSLLPPLPLPLPLPPCVRKVVSSLSYTHLPVCLHSIYISYLHL